MWASALRAGEDGLVGKALGRGEVGANWAAAGGLGAATAGGSQAAQLGHGEEGHAGPQHG
jgi:hypothetical protein